MEILPNGTMIDKITTYDEYLASDEMAKKRHVFEINEEDPVFAILYFLSFYLFKLNLAAKVHKK